MSRFAKVDRAKAAGGFTLVEVLCALAISCLALVYLMQSLGGSQRAAGRLEDRLNAGVLAQSILVQERQSPLTAPKAGEDGKYRWELIVLPASSVSQMAPQGRTLYRLIARVYWDRGGTYQLETIKLGR